MSDKTIGWRTAISAAVTVLGLKVTIEAANALCTKMEGCDVVYGSTRPLTCTRLKVGCQRKHHRPEVLAECETSAAQCLITGVWVGPHGTVQNHVEKR
jgi:hypothetical protein